MPTTSNFGWTTPADTDLVKDGAAAIRTLGNGIDTSLVDLKGGTTNQVLAKNSNTDLDFKWVADASGIPATIFDAKGDIIAATAADTADRLPVGANNTVLTADSSTATGLKWATPSATPPFLVAPVSGYYIKPFTRETYSQDVPTEDTTYYIPIYLPTADFDRISIRTGASHSGTSTNRLGLYNVSSTTGRPTTVVFDAGTVSASAANTNYEITISQSITAGYYYLAVNQQTVSGATQLALVSSSISPAVGINNTYSSNDVSQCFTQSGVSGAFATAGTLSPTYLTFIVAMRMV